MKLTMPGLHEPLVEPGGVAIGQHLHEQEVGGVLVEFGDADRAVR